MGLLNDARNLFGSENLYEIFSVNKKATEKEIKKSYYQLSLKVHPDKANDENKELSNHKFQVLSKAFHVLYDKEKRNLYDDTGDVGEEGDDTLENTDWTDYFRFLFPKVTLGTLDKLQKEYEGSAKEELDLKELYLKHEGNLNIISQYMTYYNHLNEPRYKEMLAKMIEKDEIPAFDAFVKESKISSTKRKRKLEKEAKEASTMLNTIRDKEDSEKSSLEQAIVKRQNERANNFNSLINSLEAKYGCKQKVKKTKANKR